MNQFICNITICDEIARLYLPQVRAELVYRLVTIKGIPQARAAKFLGMSRAAVSQYLSKKRGLGEYFKGQEMDGIIDIWADGLINGEECFTICEICKCVNKNERRTHLGSRKKPAFH
jgi:hypothetical protein